VPDRFYIGASDDAGIWNRALTEQEIQNLYTGQCPTIAANCTSLPSNLQQGLVGYWPFCGNANDESGNGNDGTVNGATLTEDRFGNAESAYRFDNLNNYSEVIIQPDNINSLVNEISVAGWYYANDLSNFAQIIGKRLNANQSPFSSFAIQKGLSTDPWRVQITTDNVTDNLLQSNTALEDSVWVFFSFTYDGTTVKYYENGQNLATSELSGSIIYNNNPLIFGGSASGIGQSFRGSLDDIGIWNRALTPEEVQELYTLDACTFTVYDTTYVTVYDTLTTYETVYDTLYMYETIYDTVTTYVTVTDTLLIDITFTGFEGQPSWLNTVTVFPNPASDHITIDYGNFALMAGFNTVITDAAGATVYSSAVNSQQAYIDINAWGAAGVYYMTIYDASGAAVAVRHIVLQ